MNKEGTSPGTSTINKTLNNTVQNIIQGVCLATDKGILLEEKLNHLTDIKFIYEKSEEELYQETIEKI